MTNSRQKGKRGELALARRLREYGYDARRGQQYSGTNGDADVVGLPFVHIECKWVEKLNIFSAIAQAERDKKDGDMPVVFHKKNNHDWLVTMKIDDWIKLYREYDLNGLPFAESEGENGEEVLLAKVEQ